MPEISKENDCKPFADLYRQMHSEAYQASMIYAENNNIASLHSLIRIIQMVINDVLVEYERKEEIVGELLCSFKSLLSQLFQGKGQHVLE